MPTDLQTLPDLGTTATTEQASDTTEQAADTTVAAPAAIRTSWFASLRAAMATRRANRSALSRQIAAYPASRSASTTVVPTVNR